jgi:thymidylate synthase (FAD)
MHLVRPSAEILEFHCSNTLLEVAGRTCYKSECKGDPDAFVRMVCSKNHESVLEHSMITVRFIIDRGVSHELVRHRLCSFSQESTRYCNYAKKGIVFVIPPWVDIEPGDYTQTHLSFEEHEESLPWFMACLRAEEYYLDLLSKGWTPQQARSVLPNSLKTEIVVTANAREWMHIFKLRTDTSAHPQMREVMIPLKGLFHQMNEVLF